MEFNNVLYNVVRQASCSSLSEQVSYWTDACIADSLRQNSLFFERSNPFTLCRCLLSRRVPSDSPTHSFIHSGKSQEMSLIFMSETYDLSVGTLSQRAVVYSDNSLVTDMTRSVFAEERRTVSQRAVVCRDNSPVTDMTQSLGLLKVGGRSLNDSPRNCHNWILSLIT